MINKLKKALIIGGLVLAEGTYTGGNFINENSKNTKEIYESYESSRLEKLVEEYRESVFKQRAEEQSSDKIRVPYFRISSGNCSEYAKKSAHKLFGKEYVWDKKKHDAGAAWNLRYYNPVINEIDSIGEIKELIIEGNLKPGMILGMYNPKSKYNRKKDITGKKVKYTHAILYVGLNKEGKSEFFHQLGSKIERITISDIKKFEEKGWKVMEILDAKDNLSQN